LLDEEESIAVKLAYYFVGLVDFRQSFERVAVNIEILFSFLLNLLDSYAFESSVTGDNAQSPAILAVLFNIMQDGNLLEGTLVDPVNVLYQIDLQQLIGAEYVKPGLCLR